MTWRQAEEHCAKMSALGTLVQYPSMAKQLEIEAAYTRKGWLRNGLTPLYWMGLRVSPYLEWPAFVWPNGMSLDDLDYEHWGTFLPGSHREPNNIFPPEHCACANQTESFEGAFGWADVQCNTLMPYICEIPCECRRSSPPGPSLRQLLHAPPAQPLPCSRVPAR